MSASEIPDSVVPGGQTRRVERARGTALQPSNRFESISLEPDPDTDLDPGESTPRPTQFLRDLSASVITRNDSPDIPFRVSLNPYRGCEHGCVYCYARPTHEYLGFSAGLDFETRILVKERAPELLRSELAAPNWNPEWLALSGVTDPYQPVERRLQLTRRCLEVLAEFRNPVGIVTKNHWVTQDIDILKELARFHAVSVSISLTTLDPELRRWMEPRTSPPAARLNAVRTLADAGIPVGVLVAPVIPAVNDHEIPSILHAARAAGAQFAGYVVLRLPFAVKELFLDWLTQRFPERREKVLHQLEELRGGRLNDSRFGSRMKGEGPRALQTAQFFQASLRKEGLDDGGPTLSTAAFRRPGGMQMDLRFEN